ncbi:SdpI family protein [Frigoribacterium sp. CFBP 13605]|uniref:SdpI family protein n=1 Tax=Frigoribacterium sp. CFBP 13605 TaxID=2774034 RepID=UPI00190464FF|nr:SdpI family protein [Frigoribacterium sp. CFBP 13605]MBD8141228.1 SdpI family protein [Frigoribacterium sp. CFBP 13605]
MPMVVPLIILAACAVVYGTTLAAARGRLGVNHLAGLRLQHVMASPEAWRAGHRAALVPITVTCAITAGVAFVPVVVGGLTEGAQGAWVIGSTVVLLLGALVSAGVANRAATDVIASS